MKVMLADDEILVRLGVKTMIDWSAHGFEYVGDAPDGRQALQLIEEKRPDILLTDIVMPQMNGLELIERVREAFPQLRIIVLSSHDEYDYVRKAMKLGVDDYLLKASMKPDELLELLQETAHKIRQSQLAPPQAVQLPEAASEEERARRWLRTLLESDRAAAAAAVSAATGNAPAGTDAGAASTAATVPPGANAAAAATAAAFAADEAAAACPLPLGAINKAMRLIVHPAPDKAEGSVRPVVLQLVGQELERVAAAAVVADLGHDGLAVWLPLDAAAQADGLEMACRAIVQAVKRFLNLTVSIGISDVCSGYRQLRRAFEQADAAAGRSFYEGIGRVYTWKGDITRADVESVRIGKADELVFKRELGQLQLPQLKQRLHEWFERLDRARLPKDACIQWCLQLWSMIQAEWETAFSEEPCGQHDAAERPAYRQIIEFQQLADALDWFERLLDSVADSEGLRHRESHREDIRELLRFLQEHYAEEISLKLAADRLKLNESYLSYLFKKETQIGFSEYINQLRVDKAAELLLHTDLPGYAIAERVGYENVNYFGRIFKKIKGLSPQQFRAAYRI
ncbi:response regulator [Paenibacillus athensensis]|uniref:Two-component system, response regulator YesN n=1 Tax=Paenibacillus athensensis TaxID=1967502 RepID=A0A4Y8PW30_9BACL|nr:response regulator [Paenibacillus athensensis]MCD1261769.1 response regulator [Paenibacillus athensensis]